MRVFVEYWDTFVELPPDTTVVVGRELTCQIALSDEAVSREHLQLSVTTDGALVTDLGSTNGTRLNGTPISAAAPVWLADGDVLQFGSGLLRVHVLNEAQAAVLASKALTIPAQLPRDADPTPARHHVQGKAETERTAQPTLFSCGRCNTRVGIAEERCPACGGALPFDLDFGVDRVPRGLATVAERRRETRVLASVQVRYASTSREFHAKCWDLSPGGMFLACEHHDPVVTECDVTLLPDDAPPVQARGVVCHVVAAKDGDGHPPGIGIRFTSLDEQARKWIRELWETAQWHDQSYSFS